MKFTVVGAGAIGGTVAAFLAKGQDEVSVVDVASEHIRAIRSRGLTVTGPVTTFTVNLAAIQPEELQAPLDVVLLAVKSQHTTAALDLIGPLLGPDGFVVSLQNGLNEGLIADRLGPARTLGAFVHWSADYLEPGIVRYEGPGPFALGELDGTISQRMEAIARRLSLWWKVELTPNILGYLWTKHAYTTALAAQAMVDADGADVAERYPELMVELLTEGFELAECEGVRLEGFSGLEPELYLPRSKRNMAEVVDSYLRSVRDERPRQKPRNGIWRDLAIRKRKTEEAGNLKQKLEMGRRWSLPMPLTKRTLKTLRELEDGVRHMSWKNVEELEAERQALLRTSS